MKRIIIAAVMATVSASAMANDFPACKVTDAAAITYVKSHIQKYSRYPVQMINAVNKAIDGNRSEIAAKFKEGCNVSYQFGSVLTNQDLVNFYSNHINDKPAILAIQAATIAPQTFAAAQKKSGK